MTFFSERHAHENNVTSHRKKPSSHLTRRKSLWYPAIFMSPCCYTSKHRAPSQTSLACPSVSRQTPVTLYAQPLFFHPVISDTIPSDEPAAKRTMSLRGTWREWGATPPRRTPS